VSLRQFTKAEGLVGHKSYESELAMSERATDQRQWLERIVDAELSVGERRSTEYRQGMLDAYCFRVLGTPIPPLRFRLGSAQADAHFAGNVRGHALWRVHAAATPSTQ
jgi:hypothetical protein